MATTLECNPSADVVTCEVPRGSVLLLNNLSSHIRWSFDLRWQHPDEPCGFCASDQGGKVARGGRGGERVHVSERDTKTERQRQTESDRQRLPPFLFACGGGVITACTFFFALLSMACTTLAAFGSRDQRNASPATGWAGPRRQLERVGRYEARTKQNASRTQAR